MKIRITHFMLLLGICIVYACEEPYEVELEVAEKEYVVDGKITDQPGPHLVKITLSSSYTKYAGGLNYPVSGALVTVTDHDGNTEILTETETGHYYTSSGFLGRPGNQYVLYIRTPDGDELSSFPETMPSAFVITDYFYEYVVDPVSGNQGHQVWVRIADPSGQENFYKWRWEGAYLFSTSFFGFPGASLCWRYETDNTLLKITSDRYFNGNEINLDICVIPYFSGSNYLVTANLESLSEEAFDFYSEIDRQINQLGGIFDPPPARIRGNMYFVNDDTKNVLGYFSAVSSRQQPVLIKRSDYGAIRNRREYPRNIYCWTLPNSEEFNNDPSTWPDGWE